MDDVRSRGLEGLKILASGAARFMELKGSLILATPVIWNHLQSSPISRCAIYYHFFVSSSTFVMEIIPNLAWLGKMQNGKDLFYK